MNFNMKRSPMNLFTENEASLVGFVGVKRPFQHKQATSCHRRMKYILCRARGKHIAT